MTTTPIGPVSSTSITSTAPTRVPKQAMDSTVFMDLLVTQLRNQDPSSPMDTNADDRRRPPSWPSWRS